MTKAIKVFKNKPIIPLGFFLAVTVVLIVVSFAVLNIPIVAICSIAILEVLLSALLNRIPLWVQGLLVVAQIAAGFIFGRAVFMVLMAIVYVLAVAFLYLWTSEEA